MLSCCILLIIWVSFHQGQILSEDLCHGRYVCTDSTFVFQFLGKLPKHPCRAGDPEGPIFSSLDQLPFECSTVTNLGPPYKGARKLRKSWSESEAALNICRNMEDSAIFSGNVFLKDHLLQTSCLVSHVILSALHAATVDAEVIDPHMPLRQSHHRSKTNHLKQSQCLPQSPQSHSSVGGFVGGYAKFDGFGGHNFKSVGRRWLKFMTDKFLRTFCWIISPWELLLKLRPITAFTTSIFIPTGKGHGSTNAWKPKYCQNSSFQSVSSVLALHDFQLGSSSSHMKKKCTLKLAAMRHHFSSQHLHTNAVSIQHSLK